MPALIERLRRLSLWWGACSARCRWRVILGVFALGLVIWLLGADKPWELPHTLKLRHLVASMTWWGGAFGGVVLLGLMALVPWWEGKWDGQEEGGIRATPRWFWPLVIVAMVLTACFAWPRLGFSFWDDEELCARDTLVGRFRMDEESGKPRFVPRSWQETVFGYKTPNNHVLHSIFSRLLGSFAPPGDLPFSEFALRIPAWIFGILSVGALAWFLKDAGFALAGVVGAFLLALHPWHIRYASEARGYSLVLLLVPLLFVFWCRAIVRGSWRWWAGCAAAQFALIFTYPGMLFLLVALNILTLPVLALAPCAARPFRLQSGRWFFTNSCAAIGAVIFMLPLVPQARAYFYHESSLQITLGWPWVWRALSFLLAGVPWANGNDAMALRHLAEHHALVVPGFVLGVVVLLAVGLVAFSRQGLPHACLAVVILGTPLATFAFSRMRQMMIYESYIIYALPGLVALVAVGIVKTTDRLRRLPGGRVMAPAVAISLVAAYAAVTGGFRQGIVRHPLQQIRESVLACRPTLNPEDPRQAGILTTSFCIPPYLYDAHLIRADSANELIALMRNADQTGKTLFVNIGMPWAAREYSPRMWAMISDDRLFSDRREFPGFDTGLDRIVVRYRPGSAASVDLSAWRGDER